MNTAQLEDIQYFELPKTRRGRRVSRENETHPTVE
jgi:hypothetical protein